MSVLAFVAGNAGGSAPDAGERFVKADGRAAAAAFIQHVDGQRREAVETGRIIGRPAPQQQQDGDDRNRGVSDRPDAQSARERRLLDGRKEERPGGPGLWQPRSNGALHFALHLTSTGLDP